MEGCGGVEGWGGGGRRQSGKTRLTYPLSSGNTLPPVDEVMMFWEDGWGWDWGGAGGMGRVGGGGGRRQSSKTRLPYPFSSGITLPTALAAYVDEVIMF